MRACAFACARTHVCVSVRVSVQSCVECACVCVILVHVCESSNCVSSVRVCVILELCVECACVCHPRIGSASIVNLNRKPISMGL